MLRNLVVYHQVKPSVDCPDGIASAWVASQFFSQYQEVSYLGWCYEYKDAPEVAEYHRVFVVDFSFPQSVLESWADLGIQITVIDHHQTAMNDLRGLSDRIIQRFDLKECGATLAWKYLIDAPMPHFLHYVRDRDLWNFLLPDTREVYEAMSTLRYKLSAFGERKREMTFAFFDFLAEMSEEELINYLKPIGFPLVEPKRKMVNEIAERHQFVDFQDNPDWHVPVVHLKDDGSEDRYVSDVCMKLYRDYPKAPFSACFTSQATWSLRSDKHGNNTDVGAIAKQFGGGGHHNASGFAS